MVTILIIFFVLFIASIVWGFVSDWYDTPPIIFAMIFFFTLMVAFMMSAKWKVSSQTLTGYVYSRSESFGYAHYELRFSQNAGADTQPSFCVKAGSEADKAFQAVVGKDTKVSLDVPRAGFRFSNNPFECDSEARLNSKQD